VKAVLDVLRDRRLLAASGVGVGAASGAGTGASASAAGILRRA